jgi:4-hydroxybutyrate CoA-transferase
LSRVDVDYIVTEFGIAKLRGASVHERARAIIDVAAPDFREQLSKAWDEIAQRL